MPRIDPGAIGRPIEVPDVLWDERDVLLYAVGVGAGRDDPYTELEFTTENSEGKKLRVLPTFGVILSHRLTEASYGGIDLTAIVHAEQSLELAGPLPVSGRAILSAQVTEIWEFARRAGFERPILPGLCTFGFTGRALLHAVCGSDPARFGAIEARFTAPVIAGQTLHVEAWEENDEVTFRTVGPHETTVLDRGVLRHV